MGAGPASFPADRVPERGGDIPDMTAYVREVMRRVERDLDTKLQWIAVNHHNTDNPHAHVLLRGKQDRTGPIWSSPRQYISYGIRDRASEVATELLGERHPEEVQDWPSPRRSKPSGLPPWTG
jgi:type IV secretory pathway VirD2 relaxase